MKIIIHPLVDEPRLARIREAAGNATVVNVRTDGDALGEIAEADALLGKITPPLLAASRNLRWVQSLTAGLEKTMFPELVDHPCTLTNMRGLFSDVIADHVFGYILCFARNLHRYIRRRSWAPVGGEESRPAYAAGVGAGNVTSMDRAHLHVSDATLGVVGLGSIGSEVARRARAFGMRVLAVDPVNADAWPMDRFDELLAESDFVVIAAPHTPDTQGMFDRARIGKMKRTAILINIGRGAIVRIADLTAALEAGEIAGAALDVFETEPLPPDHPLWSMENVILTPHVAACSVRVPERHLEVLLDNVGRFVRGEELRNVVNKERWC